MCGAAEDAEGQRGAVVCEWGEDGVDSHEGVVVEGEDCVCPGASARQSSSQSSS